MESGSQLSPQDLVEAARQGTLLRQFYQEKADENPDGNHMTAVDYSRLQLLRELNVLIRERSLTVAQGKLLLATHMAIEFAVIRDLKKPK